MRVFVTVGSTRFDALVEASLSPSVLIALKHRGYTELVVQCGSYKADLGVADNEGVWKRRADGLSIELWRYKASILAEIQNADLIISHAGSGTILDTLRIGKPLIVVPNPTLADNHQQELADELDKMGYLRAATVLNLHHCIQTLQPSGLLAFPQKDTEKFSQFLDDLMGF